MESLGFSPHTWVDCIIKRLIDSISGRGGTEALCTFFDQIDWVPELLDVTQKIKVESIFFETALAKCNKELLKRPVSVRQEEVFQMLYKAGFSINDYTKKIEWLINNDVIGFMPEVLLMHVAYDRLADAYCNTFTGLKLVIDKTAEQFGWGTFAVHSAQVRDYMDRYFLGYLAGEQKIPREEKQILQFIVRGNLARVDQEKAFNLIHLGLEVVKWGFIYEVLSAPGAFNLYSKTRAEYGKPYNELNAAIRLNTASTFGEQHKPKIKIRTGQAGGYYAPCMVMPTGTWESGSLTQDIILEPLYRLPIFPKADQGSLQAIYAPLGSGKTVLLSALANYGILNKHELIFSPLNDKSDSFSLACIPMFAFNKRTENLIRGLKILQIEPQGVPILTLTFLRKDEKFPDPEAHPPTIYDRIVRIENAKNFDLDFKLVMSTLKEIAENYGYSKSVGLINVRNLDRGDLNTNTNIDIQIASNLLWHFDRWRKGHLTDPARVSIDEVSYLAPSSLNLFASDTQKSGASISDFIKESRRNYVSCDVGSLAKDEQVAVVSKTDGFKLVEIGNFVDSLLSPSVDAMLGNWPFLIPSFNPQTLKLDFLPLVGISRHKKANSICKVKLDFGKSVQVTDNHSLFGIDSSGDIHPIAVKNLKKGDFVACPRKLHFERKLTQFNLVKFLIENYDDTALSKIFLRPCAFRHHLIDSFGLRRQKQLCNLRLDQRHRLSLLTLKRAFPSSAFDIERLEKWFVTVGTCGSNTPVKAVISLNNDVFWLLGLIAADGCLVSNHVLEICVGLHERHMLERAQTILKENFGVSGPIRAEYRGQNSIRLQVSSSGLYLALSALGLKPSDVKHYRGRLLHIPNVVFSASLVKAKSFIQGFWDGDGTKHNSRPKIDIGTSRLSIANDLVYLLLKFGLRPFICKMSKSSFYHVVIEGASIETLQSTGWRSDVIPCSDLPYHILKTLRSKGIIRSIAKLKRQDPRIGRLYSWALGWKRRGSAPTRRDLRNFLAYFEKQDYSAFIKPELDRIHLLIDSEIDWHRIISIENVPYDDYVYDLEVSDHYQNFVGGIGGVFCHNTQLPLEIINEIRTGATNVFFRKLATSKDRTRSQIDFLLECLQLEDPSMRNVIRDMNNRGILPPHFWFWFNLESRKIRVIRPCPPTFALKDYKCTPMKLLKLYEKHSGQKVLFDSWSQVPVLASVQEERIVKSAESVVF